MTASAHFPHSVYYRESSNTHKNRGFDSGVSSEAQDEIADIVISAMHLAREQKDEGGVLLAPTRGLIHTAGYAGPTAPWDEDR